MKKYNSLRGCIILIFLVFFAGIFVSGADSASRSKDNLIPREVLFADSDYSQVRLSPDGKHLSYLALNNGVPNIYISKLGSEGDFHPVTHYNKKCITQYEWAYDNKHVIYGYDDSGSENTQIYIVNIETGQIRNLTPFQGIKSQIKKVSHNFPEEVLAVIDFFRNS